MYIIYNNTIHYYFICERLVEMCVSMMFFYSFQNIVKFYGIMRFIVRTSNIMHIFLR